jgi:transcriptional regulator with XRE-family HTH domain
MSKLPPHVMKLKQYRKSAGLTQQQLAEAIGITRSSISQYESGIIAPSRDMLVSLANKLGADIRELLPPGVHLTMTNAAESAATYSVLGKYPPDEVDTVEIPFVPFSAYGSFIAGCHDRNYGNEFEMQRVKRIAGKDYTNAYLIEVRGNSMAPRYPDGSRYVVRHVAPGDFQYATGVHAISLRNEMFIIKRIVNNQEGVMVLRSDNTGAKMNIELGEILCMWKVGEADFMPEED